MENLNYNENKKEEISGEKIKKELNTQFVGKHMVILDTVDSTNMVAKRKAEINAPHGSVFIAQDQYEGRGKLGRSWYSVKGDSILMSLLLNADEISLINISMFTLLCGLSVSHAIDDIVKFQTKLKWPNDILINDKKLCGILCERFVRNQKNYIVAGIGINVNNKKFRDDLKNKATSLYIEFNKYFDREKIIAQVLNYIEKMHDNICRGKLNEMMNEYRSKCVSLGKNVEFTKNKKLFRGVIKNISDNGELIANISNNKQIKIGSFDSIAQDIY